MGILNKDYSCFYWIIIVVIWVYLKKTIESINNTQKMKIGFIFYCKNYCFIIKLGGTRRRKWERLNAGGKQWQTTPKNLRRMQRTRAIPVARLGSASCPNWPKG